jgi:hypothetical protein
VKRNNASPPIKNAPLSPLSAEEVRLLSAYRKLNDNVRGMLLGTGESCASDPSMCRASPRPALQLVAGGAQS